MMMRKLFILLAFVITACGCGTLKTQRVAMDNGTIRTNPDKSGSYRTSSGRDVLGQGSLTYERTTVDVNKNKDSHDKVCENPETKPQFPGGEKALTVFLEKNAIYPEELAEKGVQGRVIASFIVKADGSLDDVKVMWASDPLFTAEALRIIQSMPKWIPDTLNGKAVNVRYNVPIRFVEHKNKHKNT